MDTKVKTIIWLMVITLIVVVGIGAVVFAKPLFGEEIGFGASLSNNAEDFIGTRTGTSTTPADFYTFGTASTTYRKFIGGDVDTAVITIKNITSSTTAQGGAQVYLSILASNDAECDTASTTWNVAYDNAIIGDINWFDAAPYIKGVSTAVVSSLLGASTTTIPWTFGTIGIGKEIVLTDLNASCLAVEVRASSTKLYGQIRTKQR